MATDLSLALSNLKAATSSDNGAILALIEKQEAMLAESAASGQLPDFEAILENILSGEPLEEPADDLVEILSHIVLNLYQRTIALEEENADLSNQLALHEQKPEELNNALESFRASLQGAKFKDLVLRYDANYLEQFHPNTRKLITQQIIEYVASIGKDPLVFWTDLVNNDGVFA